uniref:Uncharacterized protein n=1 Tax=Romanomermis culicivorax TaxID=13658 RepID=A0A915KSF6_ROMCU
MEYCMLPQTTALLASFLALDVHQPKSVLNAGDIQVRHKIPIPLFYVIDQGKRQYCELFPDQAKRVPTFKQCGKKWEHRYSKSE